MRASASLDLALELLHRLVAVDQRLIERRAVLVERFDLAAKVRLALVGQLDVVGDGVEFGLRRDEVVRAGHGGRRRGIASGRRDERLAGRLRRGGYGQDRKQKQGLGRPHQSR